MAYREVNPENKCTDAGELGDKQHNNNNNKTTSRYTVDWSE